MRRGFTLIELLVVIAIIGILSSVTVASLIAIRNNGADATIRSSMQTALAQHELFFDANGNSYYAGTDATNICHSLGNANGIRGLYAHIKNAAEAYGGSAQMVDISNGAGAWNVASCHYASSAWAAMVPLRSSQNTAARMFCIDSLGTVRETVRVFTSNQTTCP